jgi:hypothetical protein
MQCINEQPLFIKGHVKLIASDPTTGTIIGQIENHNLVVTLAKSLIAAMLLGESGYDTGLTYCAIGTGATTPALTDTKLTTEAGTRQVITKKSRTVNVIELRTFFAAANSSISIKEAGIFGHSTASATPDSGVLFCHSLLSYDNSAGGADITIVWTLTIG